MDGGEKEWPWVEETRGGSQEETHTRGPLNPFWHRPHSHTTSAWPRLFFGSQLSASSVERAVVGRHSVEGQGAFFGESQGLPQVGVPLRVEEELQGKVGVSGRGAYPIIKPSSSGRDRRAAELGLGSCGQIGWGQWTN